MNPTSREPGKVTPDEKNMQVDYRSLHQQNRHWADQISDRSTSKTVREGVHRRYSTQYQSSIKPPEIKDKKNLKEKKYHCKTNTNDIH